MVAIDRFVAWTGRVLALKVYPTPDGIAVFAQDISEREELEERLRRTQRMDAMRILAGGIAHDFNNSLTAIRTATELALASDIGQQVRADLERIEVVAEHAASLTQQLLTISRNQPVRVEPTDLNEVLEESFELLDQILGDERHLVLDAQSGVDAVLVDRSQIQQIILNLTMNALEAMPDGGSLTVVTRNVTIDGTEGTMAADVVPGGYVLLEVADTGVGMDDTVRRQVFDPFFSTKADGTGLGLSSVYSIVTQAGGWIDVRTAPGEGTTFRILLKRTSEPVVPTNRTRVRVSSSTSLVGRTILVVEDDDYVRPLVVRVLERLGCRTLEASGAGEAIEIARTCDGAIDLLLTDVVMPGMNGGGRRTAQGRSACPLKVLFMSGHAVDSLAQRGVQEETADFVRKPFRSVELADKVRAALGYRSGKAPEPSVCARACGRSCNDSRPLASRCAGAVDGAGRVRPGPVAHRRDRRSERVRPASGAARGARGRRGGRLRDLRHRADLGRRGRPGGRARPGARSAAGDPDRRCALPVRVRRDRGRVGRCIPETLEADAPDRAGGLLAVVTTCLALTWLNPHVYLDTVVLLGSVAQGYAEPVLFAVGAVDHKLRVVHRARLRCPLPATALPAAGLVANPRHGDRRHHGDDRGLIARRSRLTRAFRCDDRPRDRGSGRPDERVGGPGCAWSEPPGGHTAWRTRPRSWSWVRCCSVRRWPAGWRAGSGCPRCSGTWPSA